MAAFAELGCCSELICAVEELGWLLPTPVQQEAVPLILGGGDVMVAAETGSGKTGAFALPILQITHEALRQQQMQSDGTGGGGKAAAAVAAAAKAAAAMASSGVGVGDDRDGLLRVSGDGLELTSSAANAWAGGRAALGVSGGGCYHFEVHQLSPGICRAGWSGLAAKLALGTDRQGFGFGGTGKKSFGNSFDSYGEPYGEGDVLGVSLDYADGSIAYHKNGVPLGVAFTVPPALLRQPLFPAVCLKGCSVRLNLAGPFAAAPAGALPLAAAPPEHACRARAAGSAADSTAAAEAEAQGRCPTALILEPSRELAEQVHQEVLKFGRYFGAPPLRAALLVGGVDAAAQLRSLRSGVDVVSGTPGRVLDLARGGKLSLSAVQFFVLDEADRLLDTGSIEAIRTLHGKLPRRGRCGGRLQTLLFSATLHTKEVKALAAELTDHATSVDLKGKEAVPETVHHLLLSVDAAADASWVDPPLAVPTDGVHRGEACAPASRTRESLSEATKRLKPLLLLQLAERLQMAQCLVFCRTNLDCDQLEKYLCAVGGGRGFGGKAEKGLENPYSCVVLAGQRSMEQRRAALRGAQRLSPLCKPTRMARSKNSKKTFRDGSYYRHVVVGKRTVKEGECAAIWTASGDRKLVEGPRRVRLWFSHIRFLDRYVADEGQFLSVQYRDGRKENVRGPIARFNDPCVHQSIEVKDAYKLATNEALVVYCEKAEGAPANCEPSKGPLVKGAAVERRIVTGPAIFVPSARDWIHQFSWHGSPGANGTGSKTGTPGDTKIPHGVEFEKLRCMPDQMYCSVKDVRTSDDAQLTVQLLLFYELRDIERMLDTSNDPIGEIVNAASADVMTFGAANTYESFVQNMSRLSEATSFPLLASCMERAGFVLHKVVCRGYKTCDALQAMHNKAVAERTRLRLEAHTNQQHEEQRALELHARQERSSHEQELAAAEARHELALLGLKNEAARAEADARHEQELRHARARAEADAELRRGCTDEELRRAEGLQAMGVDLTKYLVAVESAKPDRHIRVDSTAGPPAVHLDLAPQHA